jgi:hypothetical protein
MSAMEGNDREDDLTELDEESLFVISEYACFTATIQT